MSAVRTAAVKGGGATATGMPLAGGEVQQSAELSDRLNRLKDDYEVLQQQSRVKDSELDNLKRTVASMEDQYERVEGGRQGPALMHGFSLAAQLDSTHCFQFNLGRCSQLKLTALIRAQVECSR